MVKKKRKYDGGGFLDYLKDPNNINSTATGVNAITNFVDPTGNYGERSTLGAGLTGAAQGAQAGAAFGPPGVIVGSILGAGSSIISNEKRKDAAEQAIQKAKIKELENIENQSKSVLQTYPTYGVMSAKYGMKIYPNGGRLPYPVDDSGVNVLSSDAAKYTGDTHEDGGIQLDVNKDNEPDVEIEDQEVIRDNEVYSNRLYPSTHLIQIAKDLKINVDKGDTFASLTEKISRKKGKLENNLDSNRIGAAKSAELMISKYDKLIDSLFEDQQNQNNENEMNTNYKKGGIYIKPENRGKFTASAKEAGMGVQEFATHILSNPEDYSPLQRKRANFARNFGGKRPYGGTVPIGTDPKTDPNNPTNTLLAESLLSSTNPRVAINEELIKNYPGIDISLLDATNKPIIPGRMDTVAQSALRKGYLPTGESITKKIKYPDGGIINIDDMLLNKKNDILSRGPQDLNLIKSDVTTPESSKLSIDGFKTSDYLGDFYNTAGYINNLASINKFSTTPNYSEVAAPRFNYTDRSPYITNQIEKAYTTAVKGLRGSSVQDNQTIASNLLAKKVSGLNDASYREGLRRDSFTNQFNNRVDRNNIINSSINNQKEQQTFDNTNQKIALKQGAFDSFTRGLIGNQTQRDLMKLDAGKALLIASRQGDTGVVNRLLAKYPELESLLRIKQ